MIDLTDAGKPTRIYDEAYWQAEMAEAWQRSYGPALARVAETILYTRIAINRFVDIATGPGFLLDALSTYLPSSRTKFFGVEAFPPAKRSSHEHYIHGGLADAGHLFEAGVCIEVAEHLTPTMLRALASDMARTSVAGSFYIFNTGLVDFVKNEDRGYLDPYRRGHIMSYSLRSLEMIFEPRGFTVRPIRGKSWAFAVEYQSNPDKNEDIMHRIWRPCPENKAMLHDPVMGSVMYALGIDTARAYP
ncbi:MAG TPA: hypothetical protein VJX94_01520 [Stellaceae bacterium]|nr:hypothetical protein [Stellaceae bacterium]